MRSLAVTELFTSMQGEGPDTGRAAVFVRFSGCNERCPFCDSSYALGAAAWHDTVEGLCEKVLAQLDAASASLVVLTGGEPTIQDPEAMLRFILMLQASGGYVDIAVETNGVQAPEWFAEVDHLVISPKLYRFQQLALDESSHMQPNPGVVHGDGVTMKLLVEPKGYGFAVRDSEQVRAFLALNSRVQVYFSPVAPVPFDSAVYAQTCRLLVLWLLAPQADSFYHTGSMVTRVRIGMQTHKFLWSDERGR